MKLNETETRQQIIDKRLAKAGWNVKDPSEVTEELDIGVNQKRFASPFIRNKIETSKVFKKKVEGLKSIIYQQKI